MKKTANSSWNSIIAPYRMYWPQEAKLGIPTKQITLRTRTTIRIVFQLRPRRAKNPSSDCSISSTGGGLRSVAMLMDLPHQRESQNRRASETVGEWSRSFDLDDLSILSYGKHEKHLIGDAGAGKAAASNDVKKVALAILQRIATDEGDLVVLGAILF